MTEEATEAVEEKPARVTMLWPPDLKEAVREEVGPRGLTDFVIEAVRAKLGIHDAHKEDSKELGDVKFLAQRLVDALALGGDYEDRAETLRLLELPSWINTAGWPDELVATVRPEPEPEPEEEEEEAVEEFKPCPYHRQDQQCEKPAWHDGAHKAGELIWGEEPAIGDPGTVRKAEEAPKEDLLERLRSKAAEKGVDLSGVDLKPASEVEPHNHAWQPMDDPHGIYVGKAFVCVCGSSMDDRRVYAFGETPEPKEPVVEEKQEQAPEAPASDACPDCGAQLVAGECWECM